MKRTARTGFSPLQAQQVNAAFHGEKVDYLFIKKSGAILFGYPSTTQDVDLFLPKSETNARKVLRALRRLGFVVDKELQRAILTGTLFRSNRGPST